MADDSAAAHREFWRGAVELAVLAQIDRKPRYGYELLTSLGQATDGSLEIKEGTLYPVLHRLEHGGHIEASWEAEGRGVPRKYYRITPAGEARLRLLREEWQRLVQGMNRLLRRRKDG